MAAFVHAEDMEAADKLTHFRGESVRSSSRDGSDLIWAFGVPNVLRGCCGEEERKSLGTGPAYEGELNNYSGWD